MKLAKKTASATLTYEGGPAYRRDPKTQLYLLSLSNMVGEETFYERATDRDERYRQLIAQVALDDPDWLARFVPYLRTTMHLRSAPIVMAAELVRAKLTRPVPASKIANRQIVASALRRADEPGELLGYWLKTYGHPIPKPIKRGISDAAVRLYNERSVIKWDAPRRGAKGIGFADVLELCHPEPRDQRQSALFRYLLDRRRGRGSTDALPIIAAYERAMALSDDAFRSSFSAEFAAEAGLTWEIASSRYGPLDSRFWEAMIPDMGLLALLRNLRNFDEDGLGDEARAFVHRSLTDPEAVRRSQIYPISFYVAMGQAPRWAETLEAGLGIALENVPSLSGSTLILVDVSGSMDMPFSRRSSVHYWQVAALFGSALALRAEKADLVSFATRSRVVEFSKDDSLLDLVEACRRGKDPGGTNLFDALSQHYRGHDRVVILTDEQSADEEEEPMKCPIYVFNVAGYRPAAFPNAPDFAGLPGAYVFGGLSDAAFEALALIDAHAPGSWPF